MQHSPPVHLLASIIAISFGSLCLQGCAMKISDRKAHKRFGEAGVPVKLATLEVEGHNIHYAVVGADTNPTLFFIHGSPSNWYGFENYMQDKDLLRHFRIVSIDRPGFGGSDPGTAMSLTMQAQLLGPLLQQLQNGQPLYLIGHSLGGPLAAKMTAMYQQKVNSLVLLAASVDPDEEHPEHWRDIVSYSPINSIMPANMQVCNTEMTSFKDEVNTIPDDLHRITCPVTIMQGLADHSVAPANGYYAQKELTHSSSVKLITFDGVHHNLPWTRYEEVKNVLLCMVY